MSAQDTPSPYLDKIVVRVPDGMREAISHRAARSGRSLNTEIVMILGAALNSDTTPQEAQMGDRPSRDLDQYIVRMPDGMRGQIKATADANARSMNAEIVLALQAHLDGRGGATSDLRDRFSEAALISLLPMCAQDTLLDGMTFEQHVARQSYRIADAMLAERERKP